MEVDGESVENAKADHFHVFQTARLNEQALITTGCNQLCFLCFLFLKVFFSSPYCTPMREVKTKTNKMLSLCLSQLFPSYLGFSVSAPGQGGTCSCSIFFSRYILFVMVEYFLHVQELNCHRGVFNSSFCLFHRRFGFFCCRF